MLVTSYETAIADDFYLKKKSWALLVVDEGHRLKNSTSVLYKTLMDSQLKVQHRILLTGTPIQNNVKQKFQVEGKKICSILASGYINTFFLIS